MIMLKSVGAIMVHGWIMSNLPWEVRSGLMSDGILEFLAREIAVRRLFD